MELYKYSDRIYYSAYEEERDRPAIGYIRGDKFSVAVDAGHSEDHLNEFYEALKKEGLPLYWIKDAGHNSNTDKPDEVNRIIKDFADSL